MNSEFDRALQDLGFDSFNGKNFFDFGLQRDDKSTIAVNLFRDEQAAALRISVFGSKPVPASVSNAFFRLFAAAALEPLRGGIGVGIQEGNEHLCVFFTLPVKNYQPRDSVLVLEKLIAEIEKWDELLPFAGS